MNNRNYELRRDYLDGDEVFLSLSVTDRERVEAAIATLASDPWPTELASKEGGDGTAKITIPVDDDEITVLYEVDVDEFVVDLIRIKRRSTLKKTGDWLAGLLKFEPRGK